MALFGALLATGKTLSQNHIVLCKTKLVNTPERIQLHLTLLKIPLVND